MWKKYDDEFKRNALQKVFDGQSVRSVAEELGINESLIHKWRRVVLTKGEGSRSGVELSEIEVLKKRNRELEMEVEILSDASQSSAEEAKRYSFIDDEKKDYPFHLLCRVMQVSPSRYYAWRKRLTKPPCLKRRRLADLVRNCYFENRNRYGARRIAEFLIKSGVMIGRWKVRSLMREENLKAIQPKAFKPKTTDSKGTSAAPNLLAQTSGNARWWLKSLSATLPIFDCAAADFVIWRCGGTK